MILIAVAWLYVVLMVAVVEASSAQGTVLGAAFTFVLYGVLPLSIVMYLMLTPARRRARLLSEAGAVPTPPSAALQRLDPDQGGHAPGDAVATERKEP